jgi:hypothetical protein
MFAQMRSALNITKAIDILDHCHSLPPDECEEAVRQILPLCPYRLFLPFLLLYRSLAPAPLSSKLPINPKLTHPPARENPHNRTHRDGIPRTTTRVRIVLHLLSQKLRTRVLETAPKTQSKSSPPKHPKYPYS